MSALFEPITLRGLTIENRVWMSPMMQFAAEPTGPATGAATDWHFQHFAARAVGGVGLAMVEATSVTEDGRSSEYDLGLWNGVQADSHRRVIDFLHSQGTAAGIQLVHAGRKGSTGRPWSSGSHIEQQWQTVAPSSVAFGGMPAPAELTTARITQVIDAFATSAMHARDAGFDVLELHGAHGYLIHQFLSPVSNQRTDEYGGSRANRMRFATEVVDAVRTQWPEDRPLFFRVSATDWLSGDTDDPRPGWTSEDTVQLAAVLAARGVDLIDVSTGGIVPDAHIPVGPGYQTRFAAEIRRRTSLPTASVGLITDPAQAEAIVQSGEADAVFLARELLRDPYWAHRAARHLGEPLRYPPNYARAFSHRPVVAGR
ncbi:NADH:flavin oxidoreductase/NADH oxidase [Rhodococcus sp. 14-1411-2a]|uniref:NADH:flavin oxidoreductase/NADH oxidase n=1 Tax=Rhodococcus sp. 14-1411-2a TaxID=2023151 RepID=UPI000B9B8F3A|nr:NADH:flavin oxidoreductase/NADH oxidase [Rhodococcus sp. 14-1411-2a]OZF48011.1 oxidoreductase [Rhodococcus sp. 14-1411-2a]